MFEIDTGPAPLPQTKSSACDETQMIRFTDWTRADRARRQTIEAIEALETPEEVRAFLEAENLLIEALFFFSEDMAASVDEAARDHIAWIDPRNREPRPAEPGTTMMKVKTMFAIDPGATGTGSEGPFYSFKPKGSVQHGLPLKAWYVRAKDGESWYNTHDKRIEEQGVVLDIFATDAGELGGTLKLGWVQSDGQKGQAPDRRWWATPLKSEPRPDESKTELGGFKWSNAVDVRIALAGGEAMTLSLDGWGSYKGFSDLLVKLNSEFAGNIGKCPHVRVTGYEDGKNTTHPVFDVIKWVPRPACLTPDAPQVAPAPATPAPAPAAAPAPQPAPAPAPQPVNADIAF